MIKISERIETPRLVLEKGFAFFDEDGEGYGTAWKILLNNLNVGKIKYDTEYNNFKPVVEFSIEVNKNYQRYGLMEEALHYFFRDLFDKHPEITVKHFVHSYNEISQKFHQNFGFQKVEDLNECERYRYNEGLNFLLISGRLKNYSPNHIYGMNKEIFEQTSKQREEKIATHEENYRNQKEVFDDFSPLAISCLDLKDHEISDELSQRDAFQHLSSIALNAKNLKDHEISDELSQRDAFQHLSSIALNAKNLIKG